MHESVNAADPMRVIASDIEATFQQRAAEWLLAVYMTIWGVVLLHDSDLFGSLDHAYSVMAARANEDTWGAILYGIGSLRIVALMVNGALRPCAHARMFLGIAAAVLWVVLAFEMLAPGYPTAQGWGCLTFVAFDLFNATRAARDAAKADKKAGEIGRGR